MTRLALKSIRDRGENDNMREMDAEGQLGLEGAAPPGHGGMLGLVPIVLHLY